MSLQALARPVPARSWRVVAESYGQELVILGALVVLFVGVGLYNPPFMSATNLTSIFVGNAFIAIAAIGMSMVIISGNIDVSVGSLIGGYVGARIGRKMPPWLLRSVIVLISVVAITKIVFFD